MQVFLSFFVSLLVTWSALDSKALHPEEHPNFIDTWKELEKLVETGKSKIHSTHRVWFIDANLHYRKSEDHWRIQLLC